MKTNTQLGLIIISITLSIYFCDGNAVSRRLQDTNSQVVPMTSQLIFHDEKRNISPGKRSVTTTTTTTRHVTQRASSVQVLPSSSAKPSIIEGSPEIEVPVQCTEPGYIADPNDCSKFMNCVKTAENGMKVILLSCATGTTFDPLESKCSDNGQCRTTETEDVEHPATAFSLVEGSTIGKNVDPFSTEQESVENMDSEVNALNNFHPVVTEEDRNHIRVREVESMEDYKPFVMEQIQKRPASASSKTRVVTTTHSSPNAWFGLVRTNNGDKPGNPFTDEETSLAIILDFSTSRLQIFSKNSPKKTNHK